MERGDDVREFEGILGQTSQVGVGSLYAYLALELDKLLEVGAVNVGITLMLCRHTVAGRYVSPNDMEILHFLRCKVDPTGPLLLGCITGEIAVLWWVNVELRAEPVEFELTAVEARLGHRQHRNYSRILPSGMP